MTINEWIESFKIFEKYVEDKTKYYECSADHDAFYAGPSPDTVDKEDAKRLDGLGWIAEEEFSCFMHFI